MKTFIMFLSIFSISAFAGGGGVARTVNQAALVKCKAVDGNLHNMVKYRTDGGMALKSTNLQIELDNKVLFYFTLGDRTILGKHEKKDVYVDDQAELSSFRSSGASGDVSLVIEEEASGLFRVQGILKITRAKNAPVENVSFKIDGRLDCSVL